MIGGDTGTPSRKLTGPGTPMPIARSRSYAPSALNLPSMSLTGCRIAFGPDRMSAGSLWAAIGSSRPSVISTSIEVAPRSTAANRMSGDELDQGGASAAPRRGRPGLPDEPGRDQRLELGQQPGPRHLEAVGQLRAGHRAAVAQLREQPVGQRVRGERVHGL